MKHVIFLLAFLLGMTAVAADQTLAQAEKDADDTLYAVIRCTHTITPLITTSMAGSMLGKEIAIYRSYHAIYDDLLTPFVAVVASRAKDKDYDVLKSEEYGVLLDALRKDDQFIRFGLCNEKRVGFFTALEIYLNQLVASVK